MIVSTQIEKFSCKKELLWEIITNNRKTSWRSDLSNVKIVDDTHFVEIDKKGRMTYFEITKKDAYHQYEFHIQNNNLEGQWIGKIVEHDGTVSLECTEQVHVSKFPMKFLAKGYLKKMQKQYMQDLQKKVIESMAS